MVSLIREDFFADTGGPNNELLSCGGTLLRRDDEGGTVGWSLMNALTQERGWSDERIYERTLET